MKLSPQTYKILQAGVTAAIIATLGLLALDTYGSPATSVKILSVPADVLIIPLLLLQILLRFVWSIRVDSRVHTVLKLCTAVLAPLTFALSLFWNNSYENAVFELTKLHPQGLMFLLLVAGTSSFIQCSDTWWKKHWKNVLLLLPFIVFGILYTVSLWHFNIFKEIVKEDRVIEYSQFWILAIGGIWNLVAAWHFSKQKQWLWAAFYLVGAVGFLAIAGDEISWGQRLIGLESSEELKAVNRQGETTFHNLYAVEWIVIYAYVALSAFGAFAHTIVKNTRPLKKYAHWFPAPLLIGFFLFPLLYFVQQLRVQWGIWHSWSEAAELALYAGLVFWPILIHGITPVKKHIPWVKQS